MNVKLQIIIMAVLVIAAILIIIQVKKKKLALKYSLAWLLLIVVFMILDGFPGLLVMLSGLVGIATPSNMLFTCGFVFALVIIYTLTAALSKQSDNIRDLTQQTALLKKELDELKEELKKEEQ